MKKLKKIFNSKIFIFIFGGLLFSTVSVYAITYFPSNQVTYDNSSSKLNSTNVQGAIDELYNTCKDATSTSSGKNIYYGLNPYVNSNKYAIYKLNVSTGTSSMISELDSTPDFWTASGKNIYYYSFYRIYKIDVNTGTSSVISELNSKPDFLTSSGNNVYYGRNPYVNFNKYAIYKLNVSTGTSSMISELNSTPDFWVAD